MNNREVIPGNENTYVDDTYRIIAEHLIEVYDIDNIIRTQQAKSLQKMMNANQNADGYEQRMRYRIEYDFYGKIHSEILTIRKERERKNK